MVTHASQLSLNPIKYLKQNTANAESTKYLEDGSFVSINAEEGSGRLNLTGSYKNYKIMDLGNGKYLAEEINYFDSKTLNDNTSSSGVDESKKPTTAIAESSKYLAEETNYLNQKTLNDNTTLNVVEESKKRKPSKKSNEKIELSKSKTISTGNYDDSVVINRKSSDEIYQMNLGDGNNSVGLHGDYNTVYVITGSGDDHFFESNGYDDHDNKITIDAGDGNNKFELGDSDNTYDIKAGSGNDYVLIDDFADDIEATMNLGGGDDEIDINTEDGSFVSINAGEGYDRVNLTGSSKDYRVTDLGNGKYSIKNKDTGMTINIEDIEEVSVDGKNFLEDIEKVSVDGKNLLEYSSGKTSKTLRTKRTSLDTTRISSDKNNSVPLNTNHSLGVIDEDIYLKTDSVLSMIFDEVISLDDLEIKFDVNIPHISKRKAPTKEFYEKIVSDLNIKTIAFSDN